MAISLKSLVSDTGEIFDISLKGRSPVDQESVLSKLRPLASEIIVALIISHRTIPRTL